MPSSQRQQRNKVQHPPIWERACSRMRCVSQHFRQLIHRIREQPRSHRFNRVSRAQTACLA
ncbi:hypothetical protein E1K68_25885 [Pseudomonas sp. B2021]|nr:hypothetical protein [Pseudomonas sp. B2021]